MFKSINVGKIEGIATSVILHSAYADEMTIDTSTTDKTNLCTFLLRGVIKELRSEGSIYLSTVSEEAFQDPKLNLWIVDNEKIKYNLSAAKAKSIELPKEDLMFIIKRQYDLADEVSKRIKEVKVMPEKKKYKEIAQQLLENIGAFNLELYHKCKIERIW